MASVMNILGCSTSSARTLLIHFRWNTEALFGMDLLLQAFEQLT